MIRGMSSEKPALDRFLCIDIAWSVYDIMGEEMRKTGAAMPANVWKNGIVEVRGQLLSASWKLRIRRSRAYGDGRVSSQREVL